MNNRVAVRLKIPSSRELTDPRGSLRWSLSTSFSLPIPALTRGVAVAVLIESDGSGRSLKLGFIEHNGGLHVHSSLLNVVLSD